MNNKLQELQEIVNKLSSTSSRLEKEQIIRDNSNNSYFIEMCKFLYDPMIVTGISDKKMERSDNSLFFNDLFEEEMEFLETLEYLKEHNTGTNESVDKICKYIANHKEYEDLLKKIYTKSLKLGIDATTINNVMGEGFIKTFDVMLAENYFENIDIVEGKSFILTTKLDGNRMCAVVDDEGVKLYTRQGQPYKDMPDIEHELNRLPKGYLYDGELIADLDIENTEELFRATTSAVRKDGTKTGVIFHIFDMVPVEEFWKGQGTETTTQRKLRLHDIFQRACPKFRWLNEVKILYLGNDTKEINRWLENITATGGEGVMINITDAPYECKRTKNLLKVKKFKTADVKVLNVNSGTGRFENTLGSIAVEFEYKDNKYTCDVGSGFTDEQREKYWNNKELLLGKIVEVKYFEISQDADGKYSMRFPVWLDRIREEKDEISMF